MNPEFQKQLVIDDIKVQEEKKEEETVFYGAQWIVPDCCREGRADCPHGVKKQVKTKRNIGL